MQAGWMMGVMLAALVVAPAATVAAESRKPKEIVVVGSKAKTDGKRGLQAGDTLVHRWQHAPARGKGRRSN